ncbi:MAG: transcriptional repressor [Nocardioides sp.]|nr:transcriptional repressor [Nocardioides sp.]
MPVPDHHVDRSEMLRAAGLRVTQPRLAVLEVLESRPHAGADVVISAVRETLPVSTQAVYDVLNTLSAHGVVRRFQPAGSVSRYELRTGDNHHHVVCRSCGGVTDVDCATGEAPCLDPSELGRHAPGFALDEAEVTYWGLCSNCQAPSDQHDSNRPHHLRREDA